MLRRSGILSAFVLVLSLAGSPLVEPVPARGGWPLPGSIGAAEPRPYLIRPDVSTGYATPIDPETLLDAGAQVEIKVPEPGYVQWWCRSGDGSTLATYDGEAMVVRHAATLAVRHRFALEWGLHWCALSRDGSRLVVAIVLDRQHYASPLSWQTYDLETGALVSDIAGGLAGGLEYWLDPDGRSLYQLWWESPLESPDGPKHPTLIAYDLDAGRKRARLTLHEVVAGGWMKTLEREGTDGQIPVMYSPAGVLMPDGKRFVVVHLDRETLTVVDTETMTVERTVSLARPTGFAGRLLGLLSLAPRSAVAAAAQGATLRVALHPDGRHLYVTGTSWAPAEDGYTSRGLGLRLIDVERGLIEAELPEGVEFSVLEPSPDGRSLYVVGPSPGDDAPSPAVDLRRLDAATLETLATRELAPGGTLALIPAQALEAVGATPLEG